MNPFIAQAIDLSATFRSEPECTPFGAVVVLDDRVIGTGVSSVVRDCDPTAHAEVNAIRQASAALGNHLLTGAVMWCSGYPCPLCLMACYWAGIREVFYAAELSDTEKAGFEDQYFYDQLAAPDDLRDVRVTGVGGPSREHAAQIIQQWRAGWTRTD